MRGLSPTNSTDRTEESVPKLAPGSQKLTTGNGQSPTAENRICGIVVRNVTTVYFSLLLFAQLYILDGTYIG